MKSVLRQASPTRLIALIAALVLAGDNAFALGFRIPNQDAAAIARGNAFVATADNPSAIYYNPAGITQLEGHQVQLGVLNYLGINTFYDAPTGGDTTSDFEILPIPQLHYTFTPEDCPVSLGLGIYAPFGLGVNWPEDSGFRSIAIESRLTYITLNPVIAWKIHRTLSLGVGPNFNYSEIEFSRGLLAANDNFNFKGDDIGYGFNAGILWQPHDQWSFGANYRSASRLNYKGNSTYDAFAATASTEATVDFPQIISAGVSYRPTPEWNFEFNVDYTDWNTMNTVLLDGTSAIFGINLPLQLDWKESWFYEFGVTRYLDDGWFVSGGYFYSSVTAPSSTFTPAIPDTALHVASLGVGHQGEQWKWVVSGQLIAGPKRDVSGSQPNPFTGESADGKYQLIVPTLSVSVTRRF
jgi:long-chain fatty acid transport protein